MPERLEGCSAAGVLFHVFIPAFFLSLSMAQCELWPPHS